MAKFTVVIPYYQKQQGVLGRALASVFSQTVQDFDLVIVDVPFPRDGGVTVVGPGTGLGMACYVQGPGGKGVVASEGGHMTLAATSDYESDVIAILRRQFAHVADSADIEAQHHRQGGQNHDADQRRRHRPGEAREQVDDRQARRHKALDIVAIDLAPDAALAPAGIALQEALVIEPLADAVDPAPAQRAAGVAWGAYALNHWRLYWCR